MTGLLNDTERKELLEAGKALAEDLAFSKQIRPDTGLQKNRPNLKKIRAFLNQMNNLLGHPRKPFQPMEGRNFKL